MSQRLLREAALERINALIAESPDLVDARFERASLLAELGHIEEAKAAYLALLKDIPTHFGALNNLGNIVYGLGFREAARTLYTQAIEHYPNNPKGYVNLANLLAENNEKALATQHFETALSLDPEHREAHRGLSYLLTELRQEERAAFHRRKAFEGHAILTLPYYGRNAPIEVLLLASASGGIIPTQHHFDPNVFLVSVVFVEFFDVSTPLPAHQLVVNTIGDADLCRPALEAALRILEKTSARVINHPSQILPTGRVQNAERLGRIENVITPKTMLLPRIALQNANTLAEYGFTFPLLLRAPGFHTGRFFARIENAESLAASLADMPGDALLVMQYLDARSSDGKIRKYRVMMVDGVLYPLHVAISQEWKVHYFTADMADSPENRAEDAAFLGNMESVLGARAIAALEQIAKTLGLDYGGIDFSLNAEGKVLLFEANATMVVYPPDKDKRWEYRKPAVENIMNAIRQMLISHA